MKNFYVFFFNRLTNLQSIFFYLRNFPLLSLHSPSVTMTSHVTQQECSLECRQMSSSTLNSLSVIGQIRTRSEKNGKFPHFSLSHEIARKKSEKFLVFMRDWAFLVVGGKAHFCRKMSERAGKWKKGKLEKKKRKIESSWGERTKPKRKKLLIKIARKIMGSCSTTTTLESITCNHLFSLDLYDVWPYAVSERERNMKIISNRREEVKGKRLRVHKKFHWLFVGVSQFFNVPISLYETKSLLFFMYI